MTPGRACVGFIHPGEWAACFGNSLLDLLFFDAFNEQRIVSHPHGRIGNETGAGQLVAGRNQLVSTFLDDSDAEWLFMVDADMGFAKDTVERLIASAHPVDRPVVGGLAFACKSDGVGDLFARRYRSTPTLYRMYETDDEVGFVPLFDYPRNTVVEVAATGAACVLFHRDALTHLRTIHGDHWFDLITLPKGKTGETVFGEDMSICLRFAAAGIPMHVNTGVKTTHDKGGVFLDEETYDLQQAAIASSAASPVIDVVVPTFGRADRLADVADNIIESTSNLATVTFVVEADDLESIAAVEAVSDPRVRHLVNDRERTYAGAMNMAAASCESPWIFTGADDLRFRRGWDVSALRTAKANRAKVIGTNDLWHYGVLTGIHSTHSLVDMEYVRTVGATIDAIPGKLLYEYHHNYVDPELVQVAQHRGVYAHCHAAIVEHLHPLAGKAQWDETYKHGSSQMDADEALFNKRMATLS